MPGFTRSFAVEPGPPKRNPPPIPGAAASVPSQGEAAGPLPRTESVAGGISGGQCLKAVGLILDSATNRSVLQRSEALDSLFTQVAHTPDFAKTSTKDVVKLFAALHAPEFASERFNDLRERVDTVLTERTKGMAEFEIVPSKGATPAGLRASFLDRFSSLKADVEALRLLEKELRSLPLEGLEARTAAIGTALIVTIEKLVEVMLHGLDFSALGLVSSSLDLARVAHTTLVTLYPQGPPEEFEACMTAALRNPKLENQRLDGVLAVAGRYRAAAGNVQVKLGQRSDVYLANQRVNDNSIPMDSEAADVQFLSRILVAEYAESVGANPSKPHARAVIRQKDLFRKEQDWPPREVDQLLLDFKKNASTIDAVEVKKVKDLLALLDQFHAITKTQSMTQKDAERLTAPLRAMGLKLAGGDRLAKRAYDWNLGSFKRMRPEQRLEGVVAALEPARSHIEREIVKQANLVWANQTKSSSPTPDTPQSAMNQNVTR